VKFENKKLLNLACKRANVLSTNHVLQIVLYKNFI